VGEVSTTYALPLLVERLHWPVPRVRWEAARALAGLIRSGDSAAKVALLDWSAKQRLEVDAVILPSILQAFSLADHFSFDEVHKAITAPSILSDALLGTLYPDEASRLFAFRLDFTANFAVDSNAERLFADGIGKLVPQVFDSIVRSEQKRTGLPFLEQWRVEWTALRDQYADPYTRYPHFFFAGDRGTTGSLDVRQRAVFVSAFLRTLHRAQLQWGMPQTYAVDLANFALPFNGGLAEFDASPRPEWSVGFRNVIASIGTIRLARALWRRAAATVEPGFEPLALDVVDHDEQLTVRFQIFRVLAPCGTAASGPIAEPSWMRTNDDPWTLAGELPPGSNPREGEGLRPLCVAALTEAIGRTHIDLLLGRLLLADPLLAVGKAEVACTRDTLTLTDDHGILSRLALWYADWSPVHLPGIPLSGSLTSCRSDALRNFRRDCGIATPRLVRATIARRKQTWEPASIEERTFRI